MRLRMAKLFSSQENILIKMKEKDKITDRILNLIKSIEIDLKQVQMSVNQLSKLFDEYDNTGQNIRTSN